MRPNVKMGIVDLCVAQAERRHALWQLPEVGDVRPPSWQDHRMLVWLLISTAFTLLLVYGVLGGKA